MREFLTRVFSDPATVRKFVVAFFGLIGVAIAQGLLPESWSAWVTVITSFLTTIGVYVVPNKEDSNVQTTQNFSTERGAINVLELLVIVLIIVLILVLVGVL